MKYISFLILLFCCCATKQNGIEKGLSLVTKIEYLDDGKPIIYITKDSLEGIIIESNNVLDTIHAQKIKVGKKYLISVERIERNYRGENSAFGIQSLKGTEKIIWEEKNGLPLVLYQAKNLNGLWLFDK